MGRTLHYDVFGSLELGPVKSTARELIDEVQNDMNQEFTWPWENLALELFDGGCQITYAEATPKPWAARLGGGFTKVYDDDWNAVLVVRFLRWVSTQLPERAFIRLYDEGDYIVPEEIILKGGELYPGQKRANETLERYEERRAMALRKQWFRDVSALDYYLSHREMVRVTSLVTPEEFATFTLEDAANYLVFPWQTELRKAA